MIGKDIWIRLYPAKVWHKGMSKEEKDKAIKSAGPWKLLKIKGLGVNKAYVLLKHANYFFKDKNGRALTKKKEIIEFLTRIHNKLWLRIDYGGVKARKISKKNYKTYEQKLYNIHTGKITCVYNYNIHQDDKGNARVYAKRTKEREKYLFQGFKDDNSDNIVLLECPKDVLAIEFEEHTTKPVKDIKLIKELKIRFKSETDEQGNIIFLSSKKDRDEWVEQTLMNTEEKSLDACTVSHGGTSDYVYLFNLIGLPEDNENEAKKVITIDIVPKEAQLFLDWGNLGKTLIPIIGRPHWKPKYKGAIHRITGGKDPLEHKNYVAELITNKVKEKMPIKPDELSEEIRRKAPLRSILTKYGYDLSQNPTMCRLGHGSKGGQCFSYDEDKGLWHCFHCGEGGTIFTLVMKHENVSFNEARKIIVKDFGIKIDEKKVSFDELITINVVDRAIEKIKELKKSA